MNNNCVRCRYPGVTEHAMCTMVSTLVSGRTLHDFARGLRLEHYLALSAEEQWSMRSMSGYAGGMLADAFEALLGALFMDRGYPTARAFVLRLIEVRPSPAPPFSLLFQQ
jgi:ribonuclease-3